MRKVFWLILLLSLGVNISLFIYIYKANNKIATNTEDNLYENLPFLSKRIFTENQNDILINFVPLRVAANKYIESQKDDIGYYFEYLPSGTSIGINASMEERVASLIKTPTVMAVYKQIENGKLNKSDYLQISETDINKDFGTLWERGVGAKITVEEAINLALKESDNTAARVLYSSLEDGAVESVYNALDIPITFEDNYPIISPKNYTSILRSLYLSSYLTREDSNEILKILSETKFQDMLPAGVDPDIKVSHKIGTYDTQNIFSDCGIIYIPNRPYALCIMVKADEKKAIEHISLLSKMAFEYVSKVSRKNTKP